jgi:hypothetical protein
MSILTKGRTWRVPQNNLSSPTRKCLGKSHKNEEDNTICERCSHILAKYFSKTKKEDDHKPPEEEEPKSVPKPIENSRPDPRSALQVHSIQSRLGPQHEQQKMARSRHDSQYEQLKMARSRHEPQHEQPKMARPRHDLQMNSQKWLNQSWVLNLNSQEWLNQNMFPDMNNQELFD